jgi:non-ribosomal peptide synthetase component E (peptide arylation enzyme)
MTALPVPRPEDVYDAETLAGFRAAGYWRDETLSAAVDRLAGQDRVLLTDGYGAVTGWQLREQAYRLAAALRWLGVEVGDRVQVQLPDWNEFVVVYLALARIGAVLVPPCRSTGTTRCGMYCSTLARRSPWSRGSSAVSTIPGCSRTSARRCPNSSM